MRIRVLPGRAVYQGRTLHREGAVLELDDCAALIASGCIAKVVIPKKKAAPKKKAEK